jgi:hypothetical protein
VGHHGRVEIVMKELDFIAAAQCCLDDSAGLNRLEVCAVSGSIPLKT